MCTLAVLAIVTDWWALSFVVGRYLLSSLSFRFISTGIYEALSQPENDDMMVVNVIYGALAPTLLPLVVAMKYNIYISFITLCYIVSIVVYPLITCCGLLLFITVACDAMKEAVGTAVLALQLCAAVLCVLVVIFWCGFKHWRTFPVSIFVAMLCVDFTESAISLMVMYQVLIGERGCSSAVPATHSSSYLVVLAVYALRQWLPLLVLAAAFQSCLLISIYSISKRALRRYHRIVLPLTAMMAVVVAAILWWVRCDEEWSDDLFDAHHGLHACNEVDHLQGVHVSTVHMQIDGVLQSVYLLLLFCMFWYILRKRYQYAISALLQDHKSLHQHRSLLFRVFFCCFLKCCKCGSNRYRQRKKRKDSLKHHIREPLLSSCAAPNHSAHSLVEINSATMTMSRPHESNQHLNGAVKEVEESPASPVDRWIIDGKAVEIQLDYHTENEAESLSVEPHHDSGHGIAAGNGNGDRGGGGRAKGGVGVAESRFESRIECDPASLLAYYGFDYYAYTLIIYCCALMCFLIGILYYVYQILSAHPNNNKREVVMVMSMLRRGQTVFLAMLFLTTKPIKRLLFDLWSRCRMRCRLVTRGVKNKVGERMEDEDTEMEVFAERDVDDLNPSRIQERRKENSNAHRKKTVKLPRSFYHRLPVLC